MAWLILIASGVLEAVWATAPSREKPSDRLSAVAMRSLPVGTSYAVWVGVGAALTVTYAAPTPTQTA
ncbi:hypothetical protein MAHJHV50_49350 [Mycobacterium avium subsp. hominissuis]